MLTDDAVVPYLLDRTLITRSELVDGGIRVLGDSRRHRNVRVLRTDGPSLLLKEGGADDRNQGIRHESAAYGLLAGAGRDGVCIPRYVHYDEENDVLAVELLTTAEDLRRHHRSRRRPPVRVAAGLGALLADLHRLVPEAVSRDDAAARLGEGEPEVLSVRRPGLALLRDFSAASTELVRMLQGTPDVLEHLEELRASRVGDAVVHHDVRWDNVLAVPGPGRRHRLVLVDWETAALGDRAWDLGCVLGDYLSHWLLSIPDAGREAPGERLHLARRPLPTVQRAIRAFWAAYARDGVAVDDPLLLRATRYAGVKLLQSALEHVQHLSRWTLSAVCHLQVGTNVLVRPAHSAEVLLGLGRAA